MQIDQYVVSYNDGIGPGNTAVRNIQGTGMDPAILTISDGPTYNWQILLTGFVEEKIFTVTNSGAVSSTLMNGTAANPYRFKGGSYPGTVERAAHQQFLMDGGRIRADGFRNHEQQPEHLI